MLETEHYNDIAVSTASEKMHIYAIGEYVFDLNRDVRFKPVFLIKAVSGAPLSVDISANFLLYENVTFRASYRWDSAVVGFVGFNLSECIMIGYSYDYDTTPLTKYNSGSHEIFLRFELETRYGYKISPRFF